MTTRTRMKNRLLALFMTFVMILGLLPTSVLAEGPSHEVEVAVGEWAELDGVVHADEGTWSVEDGDIADVAGGRVYGLAVGTTTVTHTYEEYEIVGWQAAAEAPAEETPAEETPAEETPAEETPAEETPAEETPAEETPAEETPAEETPAEETPAEETPAEETPAEETPAEEAPAEETPAEETPVEETPVEETPAEEAPAGETPIEETPVGETPAEETSAEETPAAEPETIAAALVLSSNGPEEDAQDEEPETAEPETAEPTAIYAWVPYTQEWTVRVVEPAGVYQTFTDTGKGVEVKVYAPRAAFEDMENTRAVITPLEDSGNPLEDLKNGIRDLLDKLAGSQTREEALAVIESAIEELTEEKPDELAAYDIHFEDADKKEVQPKEPVEVTFSLLEDSALVSDGEAAELQVYHIDEEGETAVAEPVGKAQVVEAGGKISVNTRSFSVYALARAAAVTSAATEVHVTIQHRNISDVNDVIYADEPVIVNGASSTSGNTGLESLTAAWLETYKKADTSTCWYYGNSLKSTSLSLMIGEGQYLADEEGNPVGTEENPIAVTLFYQPKKDLVQEVTYFDYDVVRATYNRKSGTYTNGGINSASNYPSGSNDRNRFGIGNVTNKTGTLTSDNVNWNSYTPTLTNTQGKTAYINNWCGYVSGNTGDQAVQGIVKSLTDSDNNGSYETVNFRDGLYEPGVFSSEQKTGKTIITGRSLTFTHTGLDTYEYHSPASGFFPLNDRVSSGNNEYFGMRMDAAFTVPEDYEGDLTYGFSGDDDLWVFIDGVLVLDIGGIHGAISGTVDLATGAASVSNTGGPTETTYSIPNIKDGEEHTITILYMERGGNASNCNMTIKLPNLVPQSSVIVPADAPNTSITKDVDYAEAQVGDTLTYTITVTNSGGGDSEGETVVDALPSGVTYESCSTDSGSASYADGKVTWNTGAIEKNGGTAVLTVVVTAATAGTQTNEAKISESKKDTATTVVLAGGARYTVSKLWSGNDGNYPDSVEVELCTGTGDNAVGTGLKATLNADNLWTHTWTGLDESQTYSVKETVPDGYDADPVPHASVGLEVDGNVYSPNNDLTIKITTNYAIVVKATGSYKDIVWTSAPMTQAEKQTFMASYNANKPSQMPKLTAKTTDFVYGVGAVSQNAVTFGKDQITFVDTSKWALVNAASFTPAGTTITNTYNPNIAWSFTKTWAGHADKTASGIAVTVSDGIHTYSGTIGSASGSLASTEQGSTDTVAWTRSIDDATGVWTVNFPALPKPASGASYSVTETAVNGLTVTAGKAAHGDQGYWTVAGSGTGALTNTYYKYRDESDWGSATLTVHKTGADGVLAGAVFGVYSDRACTESSKVAQLDPTNASGNATVILTSSTAGATIFYLKEISAPDGYQVSDTVYAVTLTQTAGDKTYAADTTDPYVEVRTTHYTAALSGQGVSGSTINISNALRTGTLQIVKALSGDLTATDKTYYFDVYAGTGSNKVAENVAVTTTTPGTVSGLSYGTYTIVEQALGDETSYNWTGVTYSGAAGVVASSDGANRSAVVSFHPAASGQTVTVTATNSYAIKRAGLTIQKRISVDDWALVGDGYQVTINYTYGGAASYNASGSVTFAKSEFNLSNGWYVAEEAVSNLPVGEYTITETISGTVAHSTLTSQTVKVGGAEKADGKVDLTAGGLTVAVENVYTRSTHTLSITKQLTTATNSKPMTDAIKNTGFTFTVVVNGQRYNGSYTVDNATRTASNGIITLKDGETAVISGVKEGYTYSVEETPVANFVCNRTNNKAEGTVNADVSETFINSYFETPTVDVSGQKTFLDQDGNALADSLYPDGITVTLYRDGTEKESKPVNANSSWGYTFQGLPKYASREDAARDKAYQYTVEETAVAGAVVNGANFIVYGSEKTADETKTEVLGMWVTEVSGNNITNKWYPAENLPDEAGSLILQKQAGSGTKLPGAEFKLSKGGTEIATKTTDSNGRIDFGKLEPGTYTLEEITAPEGYQKLDPARWTLTVGEDKTVAQLIDVQVKAGSSNIFQNFWNWLTNANVTSGTGTFNNGILTITNSRITGSIVLSKTVTTNDGSTYSGAAGGYEFTVTASDTTLNGTYGDATFSNGVARVILAKDGTKTLRGLPYGDYSILETTPTDGAPNYTYHGVTYTLNGSGLDKNAATGAVSVKVETQGQQLAVAAANAYQRNTGVLQITKNVAGTDRTNDQFTFGVTLDGAAYTGTYTVNGVETALTNGKVVLTAGQTAVIPVSYGMTYQVVEDVHSAYELTGKTNDSGTIAAEETTASFTNTYVTKGFYIYKADAATKEALPGAEFKLYNESTCTTEYNASIAPTGEDGLTTVSGLPVGTYYLKETKAPENYQLGGTVWEVEVAKTGVTVTKVPAGIVARVLAVFGYNPDANGWDSAQNTLVVDNSAINYKLTITKTVEGVSGVNRTYKVKVTDCANAANTVTVDVTVTNGSGSAVLTTYEDASITGETVVSWLKAGSYTIEESTDNGDADVTDHHLVTGSPTYAVNGQAGSVVTLTTDQTKAVISASASVTNTYARDKGNLTVSKAYEGGSDSTPADKEFTMTVMSSLDETKGQTYTVVKGAATEEKTFDRSSNSFTVTLKAGQTVTIRDLPTGSYTVTEDTDAAEDPNGYYILGGTHTVAVTVTAGTTKEAGITNKYTGDPDNNKVNINVTKTVVNTNGKADAYLTQQAAGKDYAFTITGSDVYGNDPLTGGDTLTGGQTKTITLVKGSSYTFAETTASVPSIEGYTWVRSSSTVSATRDLTASSYQDVEFINAYQRNTGTLAITKNVEITPAGKADGKAFTIGITGVPGTAGETYTGTVTRNGVFVETQDVAFDGTTNVASVTLEAGETITIAGVPTSLTNSKYQVNEDTSGARIDYYTLRDDSVTSASSVVVDGSQTPAPVVLTNKYDTDPGSAKATLNIFKRAEDTEGNNLGGKVHEEGETYTFLVNGKTIFAATAANDVVNKEITVTWDEATETFKASEELIYGDYTITEQGAAGGTVAEPDGYSWQSVDLDPATGTQNSFSFTLSASNQSQSVTAVNTYVRDLNQLSISKTVTIDPADRADDAVFTINIHGVFDTAGETYTGAVKENGAAAGTQTVAFNAATNVASVTLKNGQTIEISDLPVGTYRVAEDVEDARTEITYYALNENTSTLSGQATLTRATPASTGSGSVTIVNVYDKDKDNVNNRAKLTVGKVIASDDEKLTTSGQTYWFLISGSDVYGDPIPEAERIVTVTGAGSRTVDLVKGDYTVTEVVPQTDGTGKTTYVEMSAANAAKVGEYTWASKSATAYTDANGAAQTSANLVNGDMTASITNNYTRDRGSLEVSKTVSISPASKADGKEFDIEIAGIPDTAGKTYTGTVTRNGQFVETQPVAFDATTNKATVTLERGEKIVISGLPTGDYTVTEQGTETGGDAQIDYYILSATGAATKRVSKNATTQFPITNTYTPDEGADSKAQLTIRKEVTADDGLLTTATGTYYFRISGTDVHGLTVDRVVSVSGAPAYWQETIMKGEYTITEVTGDVESTTAVAEGLPAITGYTWTGVEFGNQRDSVTVDLETGDKDVTATNSYTRDLNSLTITKEVTIAPQSKAVGHTYYITVTAGSDTRANVAGKTFGSVAFDANGVSGDIPLTVRAVETTDEATGETVTKLMASTTISGLPTGHYTVTEQGTGAAGSAQIAYYKLTVSGTGEVTLSKAPETIVEGQPDGSGSVTITNAYKQQPDEPENRAQLTVAKNVVDENGETVTTNNTYTFRVTGKDVYDADVDTVVEVTGNSSESVELVKGDYTVTEVVKKAADDGTVTYEAVTAENVPAITGYTWTGVDFGSGKTSDTVDLMTGDKSVTASNVYRRDLGSLKLIKTVTGGPASAMTQTYTFTVTGPRDANGAYRVADSNETVNFTNGTATVTIGGQGEKLIESLPTGSYTVTEPDARIPYWDWNEPGAETAAVEKEAIAEVTIANRYSVPEELPMDSLTVVKQAVDADGVELGAEGQTYTFTVTGADIYGNDVETSVTITGAGQKDVELVYGTYTVTEGAVDADGITGYTWNANASTVKAENISLNGQGGRAVITNVYDRDLGSLTIEKKLNGRLTDEIRSLDFKFVVTGPADANGTYRVADSNETVAFTNGSAVVTIHGEGSKTIEGLPTGVYTVEEDTTDLTPDKYRSLTVSYLDTDRDVSDTEKADQTDGIVTVLKDVADTRVTVTNTYRYKDKEDPKPPVEIEDPDVPTTDLPGEPEIEIPDEEVPMAETPKTGDISVIWVLAAAVSGIGLVWLGLTGRKRREEDAE